MCWLPATVKAMRENGSYYIRQGRVLTSRSLFLLAIVLAGLGAVAATLHVTPAAGVVFAGIHKEPVTVVRSADAHVIQVL